MAAVSGGFWWTKDLEIKVNNEKKLQIFVIEIWLQDDFSLSFDSG